MKVAGLQKTSAGRRLAALIGSDEHVGDGWDGASSVLLGPVPGTRDYEPPRDVAPPGPRLKCPECGKRALREPPITVTRGGRQYMQIVTRCAASCPWLQARRCHWRDVVEEELT